MVWGKERVHTHVLLLLTILCSCNCNLARKQFAEYLFDVCNVFVDDGNFSDPTRSLLSCSLSLFFSARNFQTLTAFKTSNCTCIPKTTLERNDLQKDPDTEPETFGTVLQTEPKQEPNCTFLCWHTLENTFPHRKLSLTKNRNCSNRSKPKP